GKLRWYRLPLLQPGWKISSGRRENHHHEHARAANKDARCDANGNLPSGLTAPKRSRFSGIFPGVRSPSSSGKADAQTMASIRAAMPSVAEMAYQVSGPIEIWNISSQQRVISLPGHESGTTLVSYNSDGTRLASSGPDYDIKIW